MINIKPLVPYSKMIHSSSQLVIRPYKMSDRLRCIKANKLRLPLKNKFDGQLPLFKDLSQERFKNRLQHHRRRAKDMEHFIFGIFDAVTSDHYGDVDIYIINGELKWANLGYQIHNHCWGHGYASEASRLVLELSFNVLNLTRVEASTDVDNLAARKVALKAGMIYEGLRLNFFEDTDYTVFGANSISFCHPAS